MKLPHAPIIEAVLDVDCDLAADFGLAGLEDEATAAFAADYPLVRRQFRGEIRIEASDEAAKAIPGVRGLSALRFLQRDERQLVQVRSEGYAFNRLAPYPGFEALKSEIARTWLQYRQIARPVAIRCVRMRFINRIRVPISGASLDLDAYFATGPRLPSEGFVSLGFVLQNIARHEASGFEVSTVLASQEVESGTLPVLLDITVATGAMLEPDNDAALWATVEQLRVLKNEVFERSVTPTCLQLFH